MRTIATCLESTPERLLRVTSSGAGSVFPSRSLTVTVSWIGPARHAAHVHQLDGGNAREHLDREPELLLAAGACPGKLANCLPLVAELVEECRVAVEKQVGVAVDPGHAASVVKPGAGPATGGLTSKPIGKV